MVTYRCSYELLKYNFSPPLMTSPYFYKYLMPLFALDSAFVFYMILVFVDSADKVEFCCGWLRNTTLALVKMLT